MMIRCLSTPACMDGLSRTIRAQQARIISVRTIPALHRDFRRNNTGKRSIAVRAASSRVPERSAHAEEAILKLTDTLRLLETERDEAVKTAESCARTAVKLDEMTRLLEKLALDKVAEGDEAGAREVLKEKAAVSEILSRTSTRAQTNYSLATKLAEKIGQQQTELMTLLAGPGGATSNSSSNTSSNITSSDTTSSRSTLSEALNSAYNQTIPLDSTASTSYSSSTATTNSSTSTSRGRYEAPWEKSLAEARARIRQAEEEAAAAAAGARSSASWAVRSRKETLEEARDRMRSASWQSISAAQSRIRRSATESIEQARARIAAEDAAVLAEVHKLIDRYKSGAYVPEKDLDWAFRQLERRSWRS